MTTGAYTYLAARSEGLRLEHEVENYMLFKANKRREGYSTFLVDRYPNLSKIPENVILGSFSWFMLNTRRRLISKAFVRYVDGQPCTPSDLARDYLEFKYPQKLRTTKTQWLESRKNRHHPIFALPCKIEDAVYIDLKSAYWSILQVLGWDVDYMPGLFLGVNSLMSDFPFGDDKLARNCLVTAGLTTESRMWIGKKGYISVKKRGNKKTNRVMWMCVQDVLNGIAAECIQAGCVYVHTDGYICSRRDFSRVTSVLQSWALRYNIKYQGECTVYGAGCYDMPGHDRKGQYKSSISINTVYEPTRFEWFKKNFVKHAERVGQIWQT